MAAELVSHGREQLVRKVGLPARGKPFVQGRGQHGGRHGFIDRGLDRPAPLARVGNAARKTGQRRIGQQGLGRQVQQPGSDHAAAAPDFGDVGQRQVELVILGIAQRGRLGIDLCCFLPTLARTQDRRFLRRRPPSGRTRCRCGPF
jgi:hypothetical protein